MGRGSSFMLEESPESTAKTPVPVEAIEVKQLAGYRIRDRKAPEEKLAEQAARKQERRRTVLGRARELIDYGFAMLYGVLLIRLLLRLAAANEQAGFVHFIKAVTQPFFAPFVDIVPSPAAGKGVFELPIVVCLMAYLLLHLAFRGLLHVTFGPHRPAQHQPQG